MLSSEEFRTLCADAILAAADESKTGSTIDVQRWPVNLVTLRCVDSRGNALLAESDDRAAQRVGDYLSLVVSCPVENFERLLLAHEAGKLRFNVLYRYTGSQVEGARKTIQGKVRLAAVLRNELSSEQREGSAPINQSDVSRVTLRAMAQVKRVIVADSNEFVPNVTDDILSEKIFSFAELKEVQSWDDDSVKGLREKVAEYLKATERTRSNSRKESDVTVDEETEKFTIEAGGKVKAFKGEAGIRRQRNHQAHLWRDR